MTIVKATIMPIFSWIKNNFEEISTEPYRDSFRSFLSLLAIKDFFSSKRQISFEESKPKFSPTDRKIFDKRIKIFSSLIELLTLIIIWNIIQLMRQLRMTTSHPPYKCMCHHSDQTWEKTKNICNHNWQQNVHISPCYVDHTSINIRS